MREEFRRWWRRLVCRWTRHHGYADMSYRYIVISGYTVPTETCNLCGESGHVHYARLGH